ncbi:MAG: bifunctional phosphopantothenoylcysteine decarboxylase/phosphopantothenate--cysteine ligase CoaBC, partial [Oscillospiraceae bacterium]
HCNVHVIMTKNATEFISPLTFEALSGNRCIVDTFDRNYSYEIEHISLAKKADLVIVAPATANIIAKLAHGIADDMLSTTILACDCKKIISPAMNTKMFENVITQDNISLLRCYGFTVIDPDVGHLACGDTGAGKMPSPNDLYDYIEKELYFNKDLQGKKVLVSAGATQESIDPVRYITNHSSGKMGFAMAKAAMLRGAEVTLITGKTTENPPLKFVKTIEITSAQDMFLNVTKVFKEQDIIIKAAAVADFTPENFSEEKIKKTDEKMIISLNRTTDILKWLGEHRQDNQFLCGFSMETQNEIENSRKKLTNKNADMIVSNCLKKQGAGFQSDTNVLTIITKDETVELPLLTKIEASHKVLDAIINEICKSQSTPD